MTIPNIVRTIPSLTLWGTEYPNVAVEVSAYASNDGMAVSLKSEPDEWGWRETIARVSLNVPDETPAEGCFFAARYAEHAELTDALILQHVIKPTGRIVSTGPFVVQVIEVRLVEPGFTLAYSIDHSQEYTVCPTQYATREEAHAAADATFGITGQSGADEYTWGPNEAGRCGYVWLRQA